MHILYLHYHLEYYFLLIDLPFNAPTCLCIMLLTEVTCQCKRQIM